MDNGDNAQCGDPTSTHNASSSSLTKYLFHNQPKKRHSLSYSIAQPRTYPYGPCPPYKHRRTSLNPQYQALVKQIKGSKNKYSLKKYLTKRLAAEKVISDKTTSSTLNTVYIKYESPQNSKGSIQENTLDSEITCSSNADEHIQKFEKHSKEQSIKCNDTEKVTTAYQYPTSNQCKQDNTKTKHSELKNEDQCFAEDNLRTPKQNKGNSKTKVRFNNSVDIIDSYGKKTTNKIKDTPGKRLWKIKNKKQRNKKQKDSKSVQILNEVQADSQKDKLKMDLKSEKLESRSQSNKTIALSTQVDNDLKWSNSKYGLKCNKNESFSTVHEVNIDAIAEKQDNVKNNLKLDNNYSKEDKVLSNRVQDKSIDVSKHVSMQPDCALVNKGETPSKKKLKEMILDDALKMRPVSGQNIVFSSLKESPYQKKVGHEVSLSTQKRKTVLEKNASQKDITLPFTMKNKNADCDSKPKTETTQNKRKQENISDKNKSHTTDKNVESIREELNKNTLSKHGDSISAAAIDNIDIDEMICNKKCVEQEHVLKTKSINDNESKDEDYDTDTAINEYLDICEDYGFLFSPPISADDITPSISIDDIELQSVDYELLKTITPKEMDEYVSILDGSPLLCQKDDDKLLESISTFNFLDEDPNFIENIDKLIDEVLSAPTISVADFEQLLDLTEETESPNCQDSNTLSDTISFEHDDSPPILMPFDEYVQPQKIPNLNKMRSETESLVQKRTNSGRTKPYWEMTLALKQKHAREKDLFQSAKAFLGDGLEKKRKRKKSKVSHSREKKKSKHSGLKKRQEIEATEAKVLDVNSSAHSPSSVNNKGNSCCSDEVNEFDAADKVQKSDNNVAIETNEGYTSNKDFELLRGEHIKALNAFEVQRHLEPCSTQLAYCSEKECFIEEENSRIKAKKQASDSCSQSNYKEEQVLLNIVDEYTQHSQDGDGEIFTDDEERESLREDMQEDADGQCKTVAVDIQKDKNSQCKTPTYIQKDRDGQCKTVNGIQKDGNDQYKTAVNIQEDRDGQCKTADNIQEEGEHQCKTADNIQEEGEHQCKTADNIQEDRDGQCKIADGLQEGDGQIKTAYDIQKKGEHQCKTADDIQEDRDGQSKLADGLQEDRDGQCKTADDIQEEGEHQCKTAHDILKYQDGRCKTAVDIIEDKGSHIIEMIKMYKRDIYRKKLRERKDTVKEKEGVAKSDQYQMEQDCLVSRESKDPIGGVVKNRKPGRPKKCTQTAGFEDQSRQLKLSKKKVRDKKLKSKEYSQNEISLDKNIANSNIKNTFSKKLESSEKREAKLELIDIVKTTLIDKKQHRWTNGGCLTFKSDGSQEKVQAKKLKTSIVGPKTWKSMKYLDIVTNKVNPSLKTTFKKLKKGTCESYTVKSSESDVKEYKQTSLTSDRHKSDIKSYLCKFCGRTELSDQSLVIHREEEHPYRCNKCYTIFSDKQTSLDHYWTHFKKVYQCKLCDVRLPNYHIYNKHLKKKTHIKKVAEITQQQNETWNAVDSITQMSAEDHAEAQYHPEIYDSKEDSSVHSLCKLLMDDGDGNSDLVEESQFVIEISNAESAACRPFTQYDYETLSSYDTSHDAAMPSWQYEGNNVLSAYETHRHLDPSCTQTMNSSSGSVLANDIEYSGMNSSLNSLSYAQQLQELKNRYTDFGTDMKSGIESQLAYNDGLGFDESNCSYVYPNLTMFQPTETYSGGTAGNTGSCDISCYTEEDLGIGNLDKVGDDDDFSKSKMYNQTVDPENIIISALEVAGISDESANKSENVITNQNSDDIACVTNRMRDDDQAYIDIDSMFDAELEKAEEIYSLCRIANSFPMYSDFDYEFDRQM